MRERETEREKGKSKGGGRRRKSEEKRHGTRFRQKTNSYNFLWRLPIVPVIPKDFGSMQEKKTGNKILL